MALRIPQLFSISELALLGKLNRVNDPVAGGSVVAGNTVPGGGTPNSQNLRAGQVGFEVELDANDALFFSDLAIGTLFAGVYQYVQSVVGGAAPVRGAAAFAATPTAAGAYQVTPDSATAANLNFPVGFYLNSVTPGNFCWIVTRGVAAAQFVTNVTNNANGQPVKIVNQAGLGFLEQLNTDFSAPTVATMTPYLNLAGYAAELPVDNAISRIYFNPILRML